MADRDDVAQRVLGCFELTFPTLDPAELPTLRKAELDEWDSLAALNLLTVLEEEFEVTLDEGTVDALTSFDESVDAMMAALPG